MTRLFDLQFFAEGAGAGAAGVSAGAGTATGVTSQDAAANRANQTDAGSGNVQDNTAVQGESWEDLIKGKYKDDYGKSVQKAVTERVKSEQAKNQQLKNELSAASDLVNKLATKYGIDATDMKALSAAIDADTAYYEKEANEKGISVDQLMAMRKMEFENTALRRQMQERMQEEQIRKSMEEWNKQAEEVKKIYPNFDFATESENKAFRDLITRGVAVQTAYEVTHKDEIMGGAMQYTAQQVAQAMSANIQARNSRPSENGASSNSSGITTKTDVHSLTRAERAELARRAKMGERITFGN